MPMTPISYRLSPSRAPWKEGSVTVPGSKSVTNRLLILAALGDEVCLIENPSPSEDTRLLCEALTLLGASIERSSTTLRVTGLNGRVTKPAHPLWCGDGGTTLRFLVALCSAIPDLCVVLEGTPRLSERPIGALVSALREMGAEIRYLEGEGCAPVEIRGTSLLGGPVTLESGESSQFASALLLISPLVAAPLELDCSRLRQSRSYLEVTKDLLSRCGVTVSERGDGIVVADATEFLPPAFSHVEGDASGATYFWALSALSRKPIRVGGLTPRSFQGDMRFPSILERAGCRVVSGESPKGLWVEIHRDGPLRGVVADMSDMPDGVQTLAVIAAMCEGSSEITGVSSLRIKETDRLEALRTELTSLGVTCDVDDHSVRIVGGTPRSGRISTWGDHRMAMAFSVLGAVCGELLIENPGVVAKSYPSYWDDLGRMGVVIEEVIE